MKSFVEITTVEKFKELIKVYDVRNVYFAPKAELENLQTIDDLEMKVKEKLIMKKSISEYDLSSMDDTRIIYFSFDNQIFVCVISDLSNK